MSLTSLMSFPPLLSCPDTWLYHGPAITGNCSITSEISTLSLVLFNYSLLAFPLTYPSILIATFLCPHEASNPLTDHFLPTLVSCPPLSPCLWNFTNTLNSLASLLPFFLPGKTPIWLNLNTHLFHDKHLSSWLKTSAFGPTSFM